MSTDRADSVRPDIASNWRQVAIVYWLPIAALVATGFLDVGTAWRTGVWTAACLEMGAACLFNAYRCGRIHCYFTGPFFIAMAVVTLLSSIGILSLGPNRWTVIGRILLVGGLGLSYVPELVVGKYRSRLVNERSREK